jgi:hypothetical protein
MEMSDVAVRVVDVLRRRPPHARFVPELARQLSVDAAVLEEALSALETSGRVLVREQYCPDPHVVGTDLRIVALIDGDPATAVSAIESTWQRWLGEYLANHRCT